MKAGLLGTLVGAAIGLGAVWSCSVDRPSEALKCFSQNDCTQFPGTICQGGYCVRGMIDARVVELDAFVCPALCNGGCDTSASPIVCTVTGTGTGNIVCPAGYRCNITCGNQGACGAINCSNGASCDIDCLAGSACLGITCMTKNCDITCTGENACGNMSCTSGNCTAACSGSDACGSLSCGDGNCTETCGSGGGSQVCGNLQCGAGNCMRTCEGSNACGTLNCGGGSCTEVCGGGSAACGNAACGAGRCLVTCNGVDPACGDVTCDNSCQCDVNCNNTTNACPASMLCSPDAPGQDYCTDTALATGRCDSSGAQQCRTCQ